MHTLQNFLTLYSTETLLKMLFVAMVAAALVGHVIDRAMGEFSFGPIGNGILVLFGMIIAALMTPLSHGYMSNAELHRAVLLSMSISTGLMLTLGGLKAYLFNFK